MLRIHMYHLCPIRGRADGLINTLEQHPTQRWTWCNRLDTAEPVYSCHVFESEDEQDLFEELLNVLWDQDVLLVHPTMNQIY